MLHQRGVYLSDFDEGGECFMNTYPPLYGREVEEGGWEGCAYLTTWEERLMERDEFVVDKWWWSIDLDYGFHYVLYRYKVV